LEIHLQFKNGSLLLFKLFGVNVYVHWSWAVIGAFQIWRRDNRGALAGGVVHPLGFYIAQYLCLFFIVLLHEFGHALACKSVGGSAERIVLWPLGGVAYVQPPQRPGAWLWSIAAGPLVNVALLPLTIVPLLVMGGVLVEPWFSFLFELAVINAVLLIFNMLPIYPLDGGQILRSLIWFVAGRGLSLLIAASIGIAGAAGLVVFAISTAQEWLAVMAAYMGFRSFIALKVGRAQFQVDKTPRHDDAICPLCKENPPVGNFWKCPCGTRFDSFFSNSQCPSCGRRFQSTACPRCGKSSPEPLWYSTSGFAVTTTAPVSVDPGTGASGN
jgi:Zn-dependent protease